MLALHLRIFAQYLQPRKYPDMVLKWVKLSFLYFLIVSLLGLFLRMQFVFPVEGVVYNNFLHAHSHLAMLGWIFNLLFIGLVWNFIPKKIARYRKMFWLTQIAVLGMLFSFPFQGYAAISISFSTLHIVISWWFGFRFLKDLHGSSSLAHSFARWAIIFMMISNIGPFGLGAAMSLGGPTSDLAKISLYYYLHFQYNGWFSFAVFAFFIKKLQESNIRFGEYLGKDFLWLLIISCILGFSLSILWLQPQRWVYQVGYFSAGMQLIPLAMLSAFAYKKRRKIKQLFPFYSFPILQLTFWAFLIKVLMQMASSFPEISMMAYNSRNFVIGYLHIAFLGFISFFLIACLLQENILQVKSTAKYGMWIFLSGFIGSELIIFCQPLFLRWGWGSIPFAYESLFGITALMPLGIISFVCSSNLCKKRVLDAKQDFSHKRN